MRRMRRAVVVMGKLPKPGRVKTRLTRSSAADAESVSAERAAALYRAFLLDTFRLVDRACGADVGRVFACALKTDDSMAEAESLVPAGWTVTAQAGEGLGERIEHARASGAATHVLVMGSDSPTLPEDRLTEAFDALAHAAAPSAVVVPTEDGGYALIGFAGPAGVLVEDIPWSTEAVMAATRRAASKAGVQLVELEPAYDIDHPEDLDRAARDADPDRHPATVAALAQLR